VVQLLGFKERPLDYVAAFDVFCLSSKEEGLGTSLIDAMALRIPVVATKVGGIPELITEGKTGYLAPGSDHSALAKALQRCIEQRQNNTGLLDSAQQKAKEFDISNTIHGMEAIYAKIAQLSTELST
jgi:glycosyltransferase involved in cell wall biosynthesis